MESDIHIHATTIEISGTGVLLMGPSGSGKSDLALRALDGGATLVSDDRTILSRSQNTLTARAPEQLAGRIEVRGVGILHVPFTRATTVGLCLSLCEQESRLPDPLTQELAGIKVPHLVLNPFQISAVLKLRHAVQIVQSPADYPDSFINL